MIILTPYYGRKNDPKFATRKKYLEETIQSVDKQSSVNFLHIIIDDGSSDGVYEELMDRYSNSNQRVVLRRNRLESDVLTCSNALNFGISKILESDKVEGRDLTLHSLVSVIHSDDIVINLADRKREMLDKRLSFLYTNAVIFFERNQPGLLWEGIDGKFSDVLDNFWVMGRMPYPTMTWAKRFMREIIKSNLKLYGTNSFYDNSIGCGEDIDVAAKSLKLAQKIQDNPGYLPIITAGYRIHNNSLAEIRDAKERRDEENSVLLRHFGRTGRVMLHLKRLFKRPECYFSFMLNQAIKKKKKINLGEYI